MLLCLIQIEDKSGGKVKVMQVISRARSLAEGLSSSSVRTASSPVTFIWG